MQIEQDRIRAILEAEHSYYHRKNIVFREDTRWEPAHFTDLIKRELSPEMRVLDVGCGKGHILMEICQNFHSGLGIDTDPDHIQMAETAKLEQNIQNVEFLLLDYPREAAQLAPVSFDMILSIRGPVPDTPEGVQAAYNLLRPDGLLFCHEIGELHHQEVDEIFGDPPMNVKPESLLKQHRQVLESHGFEIRLAADLLGKIYFADIYNWLEWECNIWSWLGMQLPRPDDPRIALFAERNTQTNGEVKVTDHVSWIAAVKV